MGENLPVLMLRPKVKRVLASIFVVMGMVGASLSVPGQSAGASTATRLAVSAAQRQQMRRMYASYRRIPVSDLAPTGPSSEQEAQAAGGTDWALVSFLPSRTAPMSARVGFQDGASSGIFTRSPGQAWKMKGAGRPELACDAGVPAPVRQAWGLGGCRAAAPSRPSRPAAGPAAAAGAAASIVSLAEKYAAIPIEDNPGAPLNSFDGPDCDPFTGLLDVPGTADSSCLEDPYFHIQDQSEQWCSDFAKYVWQQAGVTGPLSALTPLSSSFFTYGQDEGESMPMDPPVSDAQPGDAIVLYPAGVTPDAGDGLHVGIVTAVNSDGTIDTVNGDFLWGGQTTIQVDAVNGLTPQAFANEAEGSSSIVWTFVSPTSEPGPAPDLTTDALTTTWQDNSQAGSTGSPQPQPTTTGDCGVWSGGDGTQVVGLNNGDDLWTFGDTEIGPAVTRQDFFNNSFIRNSMVRQSGSTFTTITGGTGCPGTTTGAKTPVTPPSASTTGYQDWPASSIDYGSDLVKFYYAADGLTQEAPQVVELPQADFESGDTISVTSTQLDGCLASPIMWGATTIAATTDGVAYTYIYGNQTATGDLYLARTTGDPADQSNWTYYTGDGSFSAGSCDDLSLAQLGGLQVSTEFSVTSVHGQYWLTQEDPAGGTFPGWAAVHVAAEPWTFSGAADDAATLFHLADASFAGIDDSYPGFVAYSVRMLDPSAVTASTPGDVVIVYNVNDTTELDAGCIALTDYDANVYVPRFIDMPIADFSGAAAALTADTASVKAAVAPASTVKAAVARASTVKAVAPASTVKAGPAAPGHPTLGPALPAVLQPAVLPSAVRARGAAQLKAATAAPATSSSSSWTYSPAAVPDVTWQTSCPTSDSTYYAPVDPNITVASNPDGSLDLSWPNQGPDVWYWVHWEDVTSDPGTWTENLFWAEGPNADGWQVLPAAGLTPSDSSTIRLHFAPPGSQNNGDQYRFWVQAFAAGAGNDTSDDSAATATSPVTAQIVAPTGLTATPDASGTGVTLNWTAIPVLPGESVSYWIYYKLATSSTWTEGPDPTQSTSIDLYPLDGGQQYDFKIAAEALANGNGPYSSIVTATP
jgi:Fibronectin type III domain/CHAP domain